MRVIDGAAEPQNGITRGLDDCPRAEPPDITELHLDALCWVGLMAQVLEIIAPFAEPNHIRGVKTNLEAAHWETKQSMYCDTVVRNYVHTYVCHKGYISLFPFMTGFIGADHPHLSATLDLLRDSNHLWTDHSIRSLSPENKKYGVGDNYWRSLIWINMNYMIIEQLLHLAQIPGPLQHRYREI
jgi:mannosyl-oligosaccharide glucosidase